jgi:hypothetical protein
MIAAFAGGGFSRRLRHRLRFATKMPLCGTRRLRPAHTVLEACQR